MEKLFLTTRINLQSKKSMVFGFKNMQHPLYTKRDIPPSRFTAIYFVKTAFMFKPRKNHLLTYFFQSFLIIAILPQTKYVYNYRA